MRVVILRISDELYNELERKAKEEGIEVVGNYIVKLISKELKGKRDEISPTEDLRKVIESIVEDVLEEKIRNISVPEAFERDINEIVESVKEEIMEEISKRAERKFQSLINPWTEKIDNIARNLALLKEEIDMLKEELEKIKERKEGYGESKVEKPRTERREDHREHRRKRVTAIDVLREQKVIFEDEIRSRMRNVEALFRKLESQGATVVETRSGRVAVYPDAWEEFNAVLREIGSTSEEEVVEQLEAINPKYAKLFKFLREDGLVYKDPERGWVVEM